MEESEMDKMACYEVVGSFNCGDGCMMVIKAAHGTHVMPSDEWEMMKNSFLGSNPKSSTKRENIKVA